MKLKIYVAIKTEKDVKVEDEKKLLTPSNKKTDFKGFDKEEQEEVEESDLPFTSAKKKTVADLNFKPTESMAAEAKRALKWKEEGHAGGTLVGLARANQLAKRENLSATTVKRMHSFFSRHEVDKKGRGFSGGDGYPSKGRVAWALCGGDAGQSWARMMAKRIDKAKGKK